MKNGYRKFPFHHLKRHQFYGLPVLPLLVFIHGGGWEGGKRSDYLMYLIHFAQNGYVTTTISYRLIADAPYPACAEDVRDAVKWFGVNGDKYGYDPQGQC